MARIPDDGESSIGRRIPEREKGKESGAAVDRALSRPIIMLVSVQEDKST
jgi:hypothetical protein